MADPRTVEFHGDTFALNDEVSQFAMLEFAEAAAEGQDGDTMQGLASLMRLVKECIAPSDLKRFLACARKHKSGAEELTAIIQAAFEDQTERPTGRPGDSSPGPSSTPAKSESSSDVKVSESLPTSGRIRPDLALVLEQAAG